MSGSLLDTIKQAAINAWKSTKPTELYFGEVVSINPLKVKVSDVLILGEKQLVVNGTLSEGDSVPIIRQQGGQKYVVLGTRTVTIDDTVYIDGGGVYTGASTDYQYPYKKGYRVTQGFKSSHRGVDLVGTGDKLLYPVTSGVVVESKAVTNSKGQYISYGNTVVIKHHDGYYSRYAHLSKRYVKVGQTVNQNTVLGIEGSTGNSTGSHLHFEICKGQIPRATAANVNPLTFLQKRV